MSERPWTDPAQPPVEASDLGGGVWVSWGPPFSVGGEPMIWHWCARTLTRPNDERDGIETGTGLGQRDPSWYEPQWVVVGIRAHQLVAEEPLHLEPSILWPFCCGLHGHVRGGRWEAC